MAFTGIGLPSSEGGSGAITVPSDQIFNSVADRDAFFAANPSKLVDGVDCIILTNPPEGLYQVYKESVPEWEDRTAIVEGPQGAQGDSVSTAQVDAAGDLIITLTSGANINCGRAKGDDGDLVYQQLDISTYGNFFSADWANLGTNIYGVTGLGNQFTNPPFPLNASTTYSFECLLVNEQSQYSLRVTSMANADFENAGRDAILSGLTKTSAESTGWKVYAFVSDPGHTDPTEGFELQAGGNTVGLNNDGALTVRDANGDAHQVVGVDASGEVALGATAIPLVLKTSYDGFPVETSNGDDELALSSDLASQDPSIGFKLDTGAAISSDGPLGNSTEILVAGGINPEGHPQSLIIGSRRLGMSLLTEGNGVYVQHDGGTGKILLEGEASGLIDRGNIEDLSTPFTDLQEGKYYIDGWTQDSELPLLDNVDRVATLTVFGGYDNVDGAYWHLASHRWGLYINIKSAGVTTGWQKVAFEGQPVQVDPNSPQYAELNSDVAFSRLVVSDPADPLYETILDVTDQGNTELNMVGSSVIRAKDKATATTTDVITISEDGKLTHNTEVIHEATRDAASSTSSLQIRDGDGQVMLGSVIQQTGSANPDFLAYLGDTSQAGSLQNLESTIAKFSEGRTYGFGQGSILSVSQTVIDDRVRYIIGATAPDSMTLTISPDLIGCRIMIEAFESLANQFCTITVVSSGGPDITFDVGRGDRWIIEASQTNDSIAYKVKNGGDAPVIGRGDRTIEINEPHVRAFQYAEGMPYHLLLETPTSSRLIHEFPKAKTHRFTPIDSNRRYEGVTINTSNEAGPVVLGQYSDIPLYTFEPNQVVNRDQVGYINFPADMTIDSSEGFYFFGTVSGWAGGNQNNGTMAVYVGVNGDNPKAGASKIGFALTADRLIILTGDSSADATSATASKFNQENGVAHFYRFAVYVDNTGMMTYYIVNLNTRILHEGQQQCSLNTVLNNPKLWVAYDREAQNTSTVAVGEIHLVMNEEGDAEDLWNWRF